MENDTVLIVISADGSRFIINAYGSESEPADTLEIDYGSKRNLTLSVSSDTEDFYVAASTKCYRIINDAFTLTDTPENELTDIAILKNNKLTVRIDSDAIYSFLGLLKQRHIDRLPSAALNQPDRAELLTLIKCCADIEDYAADETDTDNLMKNILYTHRNFMLLTDIDPQSGEGHNDLHLCREDFISNVAYKAFRQTAKRPAVNMLTELGYCVNNGYYYYPGGYSKYFATDVSDIVKAFYQGDGSLYIIFSDTFIEAGKSPISEYSTATAQKDDDGWYITSIHMNGDLSDITNPENNPQTQPVFDILSVLWRYLPFIIVLFAVGAIVLVIYFYLIKR